MATGISTLERLQEIPDESVQMFTLFNVGEVIEHPDNTDLKANLIVQINRVVKPGGYVLVMPLHEDLNQTDKPYHLEEFSTQNNLSSLGLAIYKKRVS